MLLKEGRISTIDLKKYNPTGALPFDDNVPFFAKHLCPYVLSKDFCLGKNILEIGTGDGYGLHYLSGLAKNYAGIDLDAPRLIKAKNAYNLRKMLVMNAVNLGFRNNIFDVVCSFHVIEHIPQAQVGLFLKEIKRILKSGGVFVCATPNIEKNKKGKGDSYRIDPLHSKEYTYLEFKSLLELAFAEVEIYGFYPTPRQSFYLKLKKMGLLKYNLFGLNPVKRFYQNISTSDFMISGSSLRGAVDFIGACKKQ